MNEKQSEITEALATKLEAGTLTVEEFRRGIDALLPQDGEKRQDTNTQHMVFDCFDQIAHLTQAFTLEPGDVIYTGTSSGVAAAQSPPPWLVVGDLVRVEIENIGYIENKVVLESGDSVLE